MIRTIVASESTQPGLNKRLAEWASQHIWKTADGFDKFCTMGVTDGDRLIAVSVYHNWDENAGVVEISSASISKLWLTRPVLRCMFETAFSGLRCQLVVIRVSPSNKPMQRMLKAFGFQCTIIPRLRGRFEDDYVFTLTDDAWRTNKFNMREHHSGQESAKVA